MAMHSEWGQGLLSARAGLGSAMDNLASRLEADTRNPEPAQAANRILELYSRHTHVELAAELQKGVIKSMIEVRLADLVPCLHYYFYHEPPCMPIDVAIELDGYPLAGWVRVELSILLQCWQTYRHGARNNTLCSISAAANSVCTPL